LTDHDAVYGAVRFARAAQARGIRPIFGVELTLAGGYHLTLLVEDASGWQNLCRLISRARANAPKGRAALPPEALAGHTDGLTALSGCRKGEVAVALRRKDRDAALAAARRYHTLFGPDRFWIELQHHRLPWDDALVADLASLAHHLQVGCVATNNVHYAVREGYRLQDVLVCIRHRTTLDESAHLRRPNSEYYLKSAEEMAALFAGTPGALASTRRIVERCDFEVRYGLQDLPRFPTPAGMAAAGTLRHLCERALAARYPDPPSPVREQLTHELGVIERAGLANYFLIVWDLVRFARDRGILCQGRGSAANSLVAYLLGISPIDPLAHDLVFERFLSDERRIVPDIDIDFQADRREEVIQYIYHRYGADHAAMACTLVTFQDRSALRDVSKALSGGLAPAPGAHHPAPTVLDLCDQIDGLPRHLGIHNGGMVIMGPPLAERVPTEPATMPGRVVVQWDKDALEEAGLIKIDILGLRMLSAIAETLALVAEITGRRPDLARLTFDDPAVYDLIARADTIGVFQVESRAQAQVLPRLRPCSFEDLIVAISLIRPGPIQGQMVHPYLRRRLGEEPVPSLHPLLKPALAETLGVILFQEQVLKVARDLAGFTPGQGEQLRRALGAKRAGEEIERFRETFIQGAVARGASQDAAEAVFEQLRAFGGYSFAKSHAAAFAVLVYQSAWLKRYHAAAFYAALLNNQPMGFWSPAVLVGDARRHGVRTLPVDIHCSRANCTVGQGAIRLGFTYVDGLGEASAARVEAARKGRTFAGLADFCRRTQLPRRIVENLIVVGAMDSWEIPRRKLVWALGKLRYHEEELDLVFPDDGVTLPPLSRAEALLLEYEILGLATDDHILALYRPWLDERGIVNSEALRGCAGGQRVRVAGKAVVHQAPPTAKGVHFLTLEDEVGLINVVIRPDVYACYGQMLRTVPLLIVEGLVERRDGVVNLVAERAVALRAE
ncbi:MAG TPA: error-prone DNA polymerase, partial [Chloroflexi bacterium]|nr:error-prone DNA polymerase [Chloroflexota bacterium]